MLYISYKVGLEQSVQVIIESIVYLLYTIHVAIIPVAIVCEDTKRFALLDRPAPIDTSRL